MASLPLSPPQHEEEENVNALDGRSETLYGVTFVEHDDFFYSFNHLQGVKAMCSSFQPRPDDVFICSSMKSGTTWIKAIIASMMTNTDRLSEGNPHDLIPGLEYQCYRTLPKPNASQFLAEMPSPRVLHTHVPYNALPQAIKSLGCRIVYMARNPKDTFVSYWKFFCHIHGALEVEISKEVLFDGFCRGITHFGPFTDHVLSYWNASRDKSNILFLTYEDLKADTSGGIKKIADFLGLSSLTEKDFEKISDKCSFQSLSSVDVNKGGTLQNMGLDWVETNSLFRKGEVGDWKNYFTPEMDSRLDSITQRKLEGSGFSFSYQ